MEALSIEQMDLFEGKLFPEFIHAEKIRVLEEKQETLRRGLFRRWNEQEKKITTLTTQLTQVLDILSQQEEKE